MSKKRTAAAILALLLAASQVTACGKSSSSSSSTGDTSSAESSVSDESNSESDADSSGSSSGSSSDENYMGCGVNGSKWLQSNIYGAINTVDVPDIKDDFFTAVNADYLKTLEIKPAQYGAGGLDDNSDIIKDRCLAIINDKSNTSQEVEVLRAIYNAAIDWDHRNELGTTPFEKTLEQLKNIKSLDDYAKFLFETEDKFAPNIVSLGVSSGLGDNRFNNTVYIQPGPTIYSNSADYNTTSQEGIMLKMMTQKIVAYVGGRFGYTEDETKAMVDNCLAFEKLFAADLPDREAQSDPNFLMTVNNIYSYDEVKAMEGKITVMEYLDNYGVPKANSYTVFFPDWFDKLNDAVSDENIDMLRDYLIVHYLSDISSFMDRETFEKMTEISQSIMGGEGIPEDDEVGLSTVNMYASGILDNLYVETYCTPEIRQEITDMINDIRSFYREMLQTEDWLSDETKAKAIEKLDNMTLNVCYSDDPVDYSDFKFEKADPDLLEINNYATDYMEKKLFEKVNEPADREMFHNCSTRDVNAYYSAQDNSVTVLCGILEGVFAPGQGYEHDLGTFGMVIGHEITHAFDQSGAKYDKDGNFIDWWTDEDNKKFEERAAKVVDYLNGITTCELIGPVNGEIVRDEMIADMGSAKALLYIASKKEGFDYDKFFRAYASTWANVYYPEYLQYVANVDSHPVGNVRINVSLQQYDEFLNQYDIKEGDGMYLAPENRINIW